MEHIPITYYNKKERETSIDDYYKTIPSTKPEELGRPQTAATKKKIAKALTGKNNPAWKDGRRVDYRKKMGLKKGDPRIVDHKNRDRHNNRKSNLQIMTRSEHDTKHKRGLNFQKTGGTKPPRRKALR